MKARDVMVIPFKLEDLQSQGWDFTMDSLRAIRFEAMNLPDWDYLIFRDLDSGMIPSRCRPVPLLNFVLLVGIFMREVNAVEEWLESDLPFHIFRDHPYHAEYILAGMWGMRREGLDILKQASTFLSPPPPLLLFWHTSFADVDIRFQRDRKTSRLPACTPRRFPKVR